MRCKNCGWPNKPGATNCSKCGSPLEEAAAPVRNQTPPPIPGAAAGAPVGGTVFEGDAFPGAAPGRQAAGNGFAENHPGNVTAPLSGPATSGARQKVCPKCGYPLRPDADKCPNCKFQVSAPKPAPEVNRPAAGGAATAPGMSRRPTVVGNQTGFAEQPRAMRGTVNPYLAGFQPEFTLTPVARDTEIVKPEPQSYTGDSVVLNRDNTDPANPSITSREQAVITRKGDKWYITDRSSLKTTFVQASGEIELHPGDQILLGNRLFVFGEKE
ncbi:MAG: zinc-ribbon domain-containing protein [Bacteroidales bacterium]|nr:zinc-ribbon domain-containing protein [Bacteroidales bacterium]